MSFDMFQPVQLHGRISTRAYITAAVTAFAIAVAAWMLVVRLSVFSERLLPGPTSVLVAFIQGFAAEGWLKDVWVSSYRILLGFVFSALIAIPVGLLMGTYKLAEAVLEPLNDFIRYMPVVAFVPLCILWFGTGDLQKVVIVFIGTYFQLVLLVAARASQVPREYVETYFMSGGTKKGCILRIILPAAWPRIYEDLRVAAGWAWSYLVVAEVVAASSGIGFKIMQGNRFMNAAKVVAGISVVGFLGIATDYLFKLGARRFAARARGALE